MQNVKKLLNGLVLLSLFACGSLPGTQALGGSTTRVALSGTPTASYDPSTGKTSVTLQFVARTQVGDDERSSSPLSAEDMVATLKVNGQPLDNESITSADSEALSSSVVYGLVLDSSFSMLQHNPPAFEPMKLSAKESVDLGARLWATRTGTFTSVVSWFNEYVYTQEGPWRSSDILGIPAPTAGTATRLFGAVDAMADRLHAMHDSGTAAGERDRHLMLVLSDGEDNLSWFDNSPVSEQLTTGTGATYRKRGAPSVSLEQAIARVRAHPRLTVHVIGLGSTVNEGELRAIASAGGGLYFSNPSSSDLESVFTRVTQEFGSLQTIGATIPIPPGEHHLEIWVTPNDGSAPGKCLLTFVAGQNPSLSSSCEDPEAG